MRKREPQAKSSTSRLSRALIVFLLGAVAVLVSTACGSDEDATPTPVPASDEIDPSELQSLEILPGAVILEIGETQQLTAMAGLPDGDRLNASHWATWHTSDELVLEIDDKGLARALSSGRSIVTAEIDGLTSESISVEVYVTFITEDGVGLRGLFYGDSDVAVVLTHMFVADESSWHPFARRIANAGYSAFTFDFRGFGASEGTKDVSNIDRDMRAAVELVRSRGAEQVFLIGASMGGTAALKISAQDDVDGVVTISAPVEFRGLDARGEVANIEAPKLFIASEADRSAALNADLLFKDASEPKELVVLNGAAHGTDIFDSETGRELENLLLEFLSNHTQSDGG